MRLTRILIFMLTVLMLQGCISSMLKSDEDQMRARLSQYESVTRWGRLPQIYKFLSPELLKQVEPPTDLMNVRVVKYEVISGPVRQDEDHLSQTVAIEYVRQDTQVVRTIVDDQIWERQETEEGKQKIWYRSNAIPSFE